MNKVFFLVFLPFLPFLLFVPGHAEERRIVAVADVHGAADALASILEKARLIDGQRRWIGGTSILVQTGDLTDRGAGVREVMDLLMRLEQDAKKAGGRVEGLLGNHELMNIVGSTRYVTPEIAAAWAGKDSERRRERAFAEAQRMSVVPLDQAKWMAAHPPGFIEYRESFRPNGRYGKWVRAKKAVVEIDGTVFMHAGIDPASPMSLDDINARVKADVQHWDDGVAFLEGNRLALTFSNMAEVIGAAEAVIAHIEQKRAERRSAPGDERTLKLMQPVAAIGQSSLFAADGPMWFRGFARWTDAEGGPLMAGLLKHYGVRRFVTGHTPQLSGQIVSRFDGAAFLIDTGMLGGTYFPGGRPSALEISGDKVTPIYAGGE